MSCSGARPNEPDVHDYIKARRADIDAALQHLIPTSPECPPLIVEAMRYSLFAGGKRLRPILTLATTDTVEPADTANNTKLARPAACAVEMIHTYSLIHDDLPAMDNDLLRRGRPTAHVVFGDGVAILAGDGLLTEAFRILGRWPDTRDPAVTARKLRTIELVADAAGSKGMVGGQTVDLQAAGQVPDQKSAALDENGLRAMHERKTGALIRASAVAGAIMIGASDDKIDAIDIYATHLGLGFQIVDDILDVEGTTDILGKTVGKDAAAGKPTYPAVYGLEKSRSLAARAIANAKDVLHGCGLSGRLDEIADLVLARKY